MSKTMQMPAQRPNAPESPGVFWVVAVYSLMQNKANLPRFWAENWVGRRNKANLAGQKLLPKYEARNPKSETNPKHKIHNHQERRRLAYLFGTWKFRSFGLVSSFDPFGFAQDVHSYFELAPMGNCAKQSQFPRFWAESEVLPARTKPIKAHWNAERGRISVCLRAGLLYALSPWIW